MPAAWTRPGNPGAQPGGVSRRPLPPSGSTEPACDPAPKAVASIQCCQMTPAREDVLPQPRKESRQSSPRPYSAFSFKLPSAPGRSAASAPAARAPPGLPAPTQGSADPAEPGPPVPGWRRPCPVAACRPTNTQKSSFCTPARAAEVINIRAGAAIKVRPGDAARPLAPCTVVPPKLAPGSPHLSRGKVCSPLWNSEATPELTEPERERKMEKVFRVQINLKALRGRAYLNSEVAIFQRVLRTCGLDTSGPKIDNLNDQAAHVACKRVKWSPASVRLYVMWYIMLDVNSPKP